MAHFAKLDESNLVTQIIVINNLELDPQNEEGSGLAWLEAWSGGYTNWKQTSYNRNIRKNYAGVGFLYDSVRDAFIPPKPENVDGIEYILNENTCLWELPEN